MHLQSLGPLCVCCYKSRHSLQSDISLIWDQAGDTDVFSLHPVNSKVSPERKEDADAGSFVRENRRSCNIFTC